MKRLPKRAHHSRSAVLVVSELEKAGMKWEVEMTSGHIHIHWGKASLDHKEIVACSASDVRSALNARAHIRRRIRAMNEGDAR